MKKKLFAIMMLVFICQAGYSQQSVNQIFKEFSKQTSATKVNIGSIAMSIAGLFSDTMGVNGIEVLSFSECDSHVKEKFSQAVKELKDTAYETMVNANENGERTKVLIRIKDDVIHELVVLTSGSDAAMVRIKGNIKKSDIEKLVNEHS